MNRRQFLGLSAGAAALSRAGAQSSNPQAARIGISTWSFHNFFSTTRDDNAPPLAGKPWDARDFPDMIADHYHVHQMEIVAPHISPEASYIRDMKARIERFERSAKRKRELALKAMNEAEIPKLLVADFTASVRQGAATLEVVEETKIPAAYWRPQPPKLDRQGLLAALKSGTAIEGAILEPPRLQLSVRTK